MYLLFENVELFTDPLPLFFLQNNQGPRTPASESSDDDDGGGGFDPLPDNSSQSSEDDSTAATAQQMGFGRIQPGRQRDSHCCPSYCG